MPLPLNPLTAVAGFGLNGAVVVVAVDHGVRVWDAATGRPLADLGGHPAPVAGFAFSGDGTRLVTADYGGTSKVWDWPAGRCRVTRHSPDGRSGGSAFSPDGQRVVTPVVGSSPQAVVWDANDGRDLLVLTGHHGDKNMNAVFSPDGRRVGVCGGRFATLFDAATGRQLVAYRGHGGRVCGLLFTADSKRLLTSGNDNALRVWDVDNPAGPIVLGPAPPPLVDAALTPAGDAVVTTSADGTTGGYDAVTAAPLFVAGPHAPPPTTAAGPATRPFDPAVARAAVVVGDGTVSIVDVRTGVVAATIGRVAPYVPAVVAAITHDGRRAVTGSALGTLVVWDLATGRPVRSLQSLGPRIDGLTVSPTDDRLITRGPGGRGGGRTVVLWDPSVGRRLAELTHTWWIRTAAFSPDGRRVVTASGDTSAVVWDAADGRRLVHVNVHHYPVNSASFSPDGTRVVVSCVDDVAEVWDVAGGGPEATRVRTLFGHQGPVLDARYSPDGTRIPTTSQDGTACLWDAASGDELLALRGHTAPVWRGQFSRDGTKIITLSDDHTVRLWDAVSGEQRAAGGR